MAPKNDIIVGTLARMEEQLATLLSLLQGLTTDHKDLRDRVEANALEAREVKVEVGTLKEAVRGWKRFVSMVGVGVVVAVVLVVLGLK